ncbi:MAG: hypothetical protein HYX67_13920 [Candidatus Melainabacteria bacterium]|nr:hypothetical protein [Candidatus Melainabacteria bacterium]
MSLKHFKAGVRTALVLCFILFPGCRDLGTGVTPGLSPASLSVTALPEGTSQKVFTAPSGYTFTSVQISFGDLDQGSICKGSTLFGVQGLASCTSSCSDPFLLYANRDIGGSQLSAGTTTSAAYHQVARILTDDDGGFTTELQTAQPTACTYDSTGASCIVTSQTPIPKTGHDAFIVCGDTQTSIAARVADCVTKNSAQVPGGLPWKGKTYANGGQGTWDLVTVSQLPNSGTMDYREVWRDNQTGLLWSSRAPASISAPGWCKAAGNNDSKDPYSYCTGNSTSYCSETLGPTSGTATLGMSSTYLGGLSPSSTPAIRWRLPTLADYKIARANGIQLVMPDMGAMGYMQAKTQSVSQSPWEWTATIDSVGTGSSSSQKNAYYFSSDGTIGSSARNSSGLYARCVGG